MDTTSSEENSEDGDRQRTGGASSEAPLPSDPHAWRDYALRWGPYIGSILLGAAACFPGLLELLHGVKNIVS